MVLSLRKNVWLFLALALVAYSSQASAREGELRLDSAASAAVGVGFEISHGDYGAAADATVVTLPLSVFLYPVEKLDVDIEVPFLYLSSKSGSGMVVTGSGGVGRGRGGGGMRPAGSGAATMNESGIGDINMTAGWTLLQEGDSSPKVRPTFYLKVPSGDLNRGLGTGTVEAGPGISVSKWLGSIHLYGEGAYILQNSKSDYAGRNYISYLGEAGIQAADRWFVSLLAKGSSARSDGADTQAEGRLKVSFMHSRRLLWEIYGSAGFTDASPDVGGGIMVVYQF